jgi:hypothetical protein
VFCHEATASSFVAKVCGEVFAHVTAVCRIGCLACQNEFFVNNPLDSKENYEHVPDFALHLSCLFQSALNQGCHSNTRVRLMLSSPNACLIIAGVSIALLRDLHNM